MNLLLAVQFLTRIPLHFSGEVTEKRLARSMAYYPLVGICLGLLLGGAYTLLKLVFPHEAAVLFVVICLVVVTGNLHGDGLMDTVDGIFSGKELEGILTIMKDSSVGAHGVMAALLAVLSKIVLLGEIPPHALLITLVLMLTASRWSMVFAAAFYPYPRGREGTGNFTVLVGKREIMWSSVTTAVVALLILGGVGGIFLAAMAAGMVLLSYYIFNKIGGMTGDTMGALSECVEVMALSFMVLYFNI